MNLIAFRLTKGSETGSIRPVILTYDTEAPMIPIRPTAVAANDDMGVMVWVLGDTRAVPTNYLGLELNQALIDWFSPSSTYNDVVIRAADEAGGQGFVTEYASNASLEETVLPSWFVDQFDSLSERDWSGEGGVEQLLLELGRQYGSWDGMNDALIRTVPIPDGMTATELLNCISFSYYGYYGYYPYYGGYDEACEALDLEAVTADVDAEALLNAVDELVIQPMVDTRALFEEAGYVTRMYSTLSAAEMTLDPVFDFNPDLEPVDNQHIATRTIFCTPEVFVQDAAWEVTFEGEIVVRGVGTDWPVESDSALPANRQTLDYSTSGQGEIVEDNTRTIQQALRTMNDAIPAPGSATTFSGGSAAGDESACSVNGNGASGSSVWLGARAILIGRSRRRRRQVE